MIGVLWAFIIIGAALFAKPEPRVRWWQKGDK